MFGLIWLVERFAALPFHRVHSVLVRLAEGSEESRKAARLRIALGDISVVLVLVIVVDGVEAVEDIGEVFFVGIIEEVEIEFVTVVAAAAVVALVVTDV